MAKHTLKNITLLLRNDTAVNWSANNPILGRGEMGLEIDTFKLKYGDGVNGWLDLPYLNSSNTHIVGVAPTTNDVDYEEGTFWINVNDTNEIYVLFAVTSTYATWISIPTANAEVEEAKTAEKLKTARKITLNGAVVEIEKEFDGSGDVSFNLVLVDSGVNAGTYTKYTVNSKGIITSAEKLTTEDLPDGIPLDKIEGLGTAAEKNVGVEAGNVPLLGEDGKVNSSILPAIAITDVWPVETIAEMLKLDAHKGDMAIVTEKSNCYILSEDDPTIESNWLPMLHPACTVESVNGKIGIVVLTTDDVKEGSNQYFTKERATEVFEEKIAETEVGDLKNGEDVISDSDTLTLDCGNAEE